MIALTVIGLVVSILASGISADKIEDVSIYAQTMAVVEVNEEEDLVTVADFNGNEYAFEGVEDWIEGDLCSLIMCDNATSIIYDDTIVEVCRYSGWVSSWGFDVETHEPIYNFLEY